MAAARSDASGLGFPPRPAEDPRQPPGQAVISVFISYRREDSIAYAGRLYDHLVAHFGVDRVFMDIGQIAAGDDFAQVLAEKIAASDVVVALIGAQWLNLRNAQGRRLEQPDDFVRYELAAALAQGKRLIPVLVGGARMPESKDLPPDIADLARRQAHELDDKRFQFDLDALIRQVERRPSLLGQFVHMANAERTRRWRQLALAGIALMMLLFAWVQMFDALAIDTRLESYTMAIGDLLVPPPVSDRIVIVGFAEKTEERLGRPGPNWRSAHAQLIDRLVEAGAKVIVFDLFFERPAAADGEFLAALDRARQRGTRVIVGIRRQVDGRPAMISGLREMAAGSGLLCLGGRLGYASTAPLAVVKAITGEEGRDPRDAPGRDRFMAIASLAAGGELVAVDAQLRQLTLVGEGGQTLWQGALQPVGRQLEASGQASRDCPLLAENDFVATTLIRLAPREAWRDPRRRYDYEQISSPTVAPADLRLAGSIVLVGDTRRQGDEFLVRRGLAAEWRAGVELHADVVNNLLQGTHVRGLSPPAQFLVMPVLAAFGGWLRLTRPDMSRRRRTLLLCGAVVLYLAVTVVFYTWYSLLFNTAYHLGALFLAYGLFGRIASGNDARRME